MRFRDYTSTLIVTALSAAFGTVLLQGTDVLTALIAADDISQKEAVGIALTLVSVVFFAIAVFVGAIVTANTVGTVIAGRTREIALMRLIGATARRLRVTVGAEGLVVGFIGALIGGVAGVALTTAAVAIGVASGAIPALRYQLFTPQLALPLIAVAVITWLATWVGSRRILDVTPIQATGAALEPSHDEATSRRVRNGFALALVILGGILLTASIVLGQITMGAVLIGMAGGILSFSGIVLGAPVIMPPILNVVGRMLGRGPAASIAAANAVRHPARSARTTIGLVIGVTLVTMFAVAAQGYYDMIQRSREMYPADYGDVDPILTLTIGVFSVLFGFSALIAAVGMVNNLSLSVMQRRRELGLLRALGFTRAQVRRMIFAESIQMTVAAVGFGVVLGIVYGWAGAQSLLGSILGGEFMLPTVPWLVIVGAVVCAAVLSAVAAVAPSRRATRVSPVHALAVE
ncbi:hypothetical protein GCM10027416_15770 [Okibacterium endophyticum]